MSKRINTGLLTLDGKSKKRMLSALKKNHVKSFKCFGIVNCRQPIWLREFTFTEFEVYLRDGISISPDDTHLQKYQRKLEKFLLTWISELDHPNVWLGPYRIDLSGSMDGDISLSWHWIKEYSHDL